GASIVALRFLYAVDPPVNVFPSFHAALAWIVAHHFQPTSPYLRWAVRIWMASICLACVLTKQHFAADVAAGLLLAIGVSRVVSIALQARASILPVETIYEGGQVSPRT
ncbi:MAG TPA: phosphatase PAP2 family protein, partial [Candidatus Binatia bacterium]|nr:phosphatase PAP2 family protein [Candidatus Binatia bacterium]